MHVEIEDFDNGNVEVRLIAPMYHGRDVPYALLTAAQARELGQLLLQLTTPHRAACREAAANTRHVPEPGKTFDEALADVRAKRALQNLGVPTSGEGSL